PLNDITLPPPTVPPTADFGPVGPAMVNEGTQTDVRVAFTHVNNGGSSSPLTYSYDFDNDGIPDAGGNDNSWASASVPPQYLDDGPFQRVLHARIQNDVGQYSDYFTTITVRNVAPTANFLGDAQGRVGFSNAT